MLQHTPPDGGGMNVSQEVTPPNQYKAADTLLRSYVI